MVAEAFVALSLAAKGPPPPGKFLAVDAQRHRVTVTLIASYNGENGGFNFDGYSRFLMCTVPRGWTVRVVCTNRGPLRHSCAVVHGAELGQTGVPRRGDPAAADRAGGRATPRASRSARAGRASTASPAWCAGHEDARMWDVLKVTRGGKPSVADLRAK